jgi:hypothetical protein
MASHDQRADSAQRVGSRSTTVLGGICAYSRYETDLSRLSVDGYLTKTDESDSVWKQMAFLPLESKPRVV